MKRKYGNKLVWKLISKIIFQATLYTICLIILYFMGNFVCRLFTWQPSDFFYRVFKAIEDNVLFFFFTWLIGFIVICVLNLSKFLSYIDAIVDASQVLVSESDEVIRLPEDLASVETRMNQVKQDSLHNLKLAHENEQRKNDLIVYLAHDIKTPLTSMVGYLSLLDEIDDMPKSKRKKYVSIALDKAYKLEDLINELFDITRFNSETIILKNEEVNLRLMLEQIIDDFYPTLNELNKKIELFLEDNIILYGDSDKLARVFNNIIKNAINYSIGEYPIKIEVNKIEENASIIISNRGNKMSDVELQKIFEKFYRLDSSRTSKTGGSGLGLAIAKEIVELHGGTIKATSDLEYTSFYVSLPLRKS